jgi:GMP synthase-like glutamine amidotransferase
MRIAVIENSEDLAGYFIGHMDGVEADVFPVWKDPVFPTDEYDAYILTGDYHNISDGLLPFHEKEIEFVKSISGRRIFASCFAHQLVAHMNGGMVGQREVRFFGWHPVQVMEPHPVFKGLDDPVFLSLNGDEVIEAPPDARSLASNPDCTYQTLLYSDRILTCQSHPEILKEDAFKIIGKHRDRLADRCPDMDGIIARTEGVADDEASREFMANVVKWLLEG